MPGVDLHTDIVFLSGVGPQRAKLLKEQMGIATLGDLLTCFPYKHIDRSKLYYSHELTPEMPYVQLCGRFLSFTVEGVGRKQRLVGHFSDGHGVVDMVWFNSIPYIRKAYDELHTYVVFGKPTFFNGRYNITHPEVEPAEQVELSALGMFPNYSIPEKAKKRGVTQRMMQGLVRNLLRLLQAPLPEVLPADLVSRMRLMTRDEAVRAMHFPKNALELSAGSYRMKFEELFFVQLNILRYTQLRKRQYVGLPVNRVGDLFNGFYYHHLPFELTGAQKRVIREMREDMRSGRQMNRLCRATWAAARPWWR